MAARAGRRSKGSVNFDANGTLLPLNSPSRKKEFVGTTGFKVVCRSASQPTGDVIVYAAFNNGTTSGANAAGGVWRSLDTGKTWQLMKAGNATAIILDQNSASAQSGNLQNVYGRLRWRRRLFLTQPRSALEHHGRAS